METILIKSVPYLCAIFLVIAVIIAVRDLTWLFRNYRRY